MGAGHRGSATLTMDNDGRSTPAGRSGPGNGLVGLTERVAALGGTVSTARTGGDGFRLVATLPLGRTPELP